jgi:hypothetical protein
MCMPQAAAAALKAQTCELYVPKRNYPDSFELIELTAFDLHHVMDRGSANGNGTARYLHVMDLGQFGLSEMQNGAAAHG